MSFESDGFAEGSWFVRAREHEGDYGDRRRACVYLYPLRRAARETNGRNRDELPAAVSSFILLCISVQIVWNGLTALLKTMPR
jgi:hypothetical protein